MPCFPHQGAKYLLTKDLLPSDQFFTVYVSIQMKTLLVYNFVCFVNKKCLHKTVFLFADINVKLVPFRIQSFQRKSDAVSVCLVFEAAGVEDYRGAGYHHPQESVSAPKGLDSYPAIFSYPNVGL